jgi:hypothetical protein
VAERVGQVKDLPGVAGYHEQDGGSQASDRVASLAYRDGTESHLPTPKLPDVNLSQNSCNQELSCADNSGLSCENPEDGGSLTYHERRGQTGRVLLVDETQIEDSGH